MNENQQPPNGLSKKTKIFLASLVTISAANMAFFAYYSNKDKIKTKDEVATKPVDKIEAFKQKELDYQLKITGFDPKNYKLPTPNLANIAEQGGCKFGFGGDMPKLHQGMFSETLYGLDAEKISTEVADEFAYAPFVQSYYVVGDILFRKPLDLFDRKIITMGELERNRSDSRIIVGDTALKNSYQTMESKFGFPQSYLVQQAGNVATFSAFNDDCNKQLALKNMTYTKVDLSGLPITALLSATYHTSLYHGLNGLFNHTKKSPDFVSEDFLEWAQSNNRAYLSIVNNENGLLFPEGAYMYAIKEYESKSETVYVDFKLDPINITLNEWKAEVAKETKLSDSQIVFVEEKFKDFEIIKVAKVGDLAPLSRFALAKKDGKYYLAQWELPGKTEVQGNEPNRSSMVLMNLKALTPALTLFKSHYQGNQLDLGTDNADLDQRLLNVSEEKSLDISKLFPQKE